MPFFLCFRFATSSAIPALFSISASVLASSLLETLSRLF
jgi:hypothetical protein